MCCLIDETLKFCPVRDCPRGSNGADPTLDQDELEDVVIRDGSKIANWGEEVVLIGKKVRHLELVGDWVCLLYTSPSPRD